MNKISLFKATLPFIFVVNFSAYSAFSEREETEPVKPGFQIGRKYEAPAFASPEEAQKELTAILDRMQARRQVHQDDSHGVTISRAVSEYWQWIAGTVVFHVGVFVAAPHVRRNLVARGVLPLAPETERRLRWTMYAVQAVALPAAGYAVYSAMTDDTLERLKKEAF